MPDTPTPPAALTDEQIDGGFDSDGIGLMYESLIQIWAERYGETRAVSDWLAAVIARAKREERERIATAIEDVLVRHGRHMTPNEQIGYFESARIARREATNG